MNDRPGFEQRLTKREIEICGLVTKGLSNKEIAEQLHLAEGTVKNHLISIYEKLDVQNRAQLAARYVAEYEQPGTELIDPSLTDIGNTTEMGAKLHRSSHLYHLPETIFLPFQKQPFVIGRFDISIGRKQSDFEFAKDTKAVSRRHAAIEHTARGVVVTDLNSRAGTLVNGQKIAPGEPYLLKDGDQLSFGNAGADYIFEE